MKVVNRNKKSLFKKFDPTDYYKSLSRSLLLVLTAGLILLPATSSTRVKHLIQKLKGKFNMMNDQLSWQAMPAAAATACPLPYRIFDGAYAWHINWTKEHEVSSLPDSGILSSGMWLCLKYDSSHEEALVGWISKVKKRAAQQNIPLLKAVVFVDYQSNDSNEVHRLKRVFKQVGASIADVYESGEDFNSTVRQYGEKIEQVRKRAKTDIARRDELLGISDPATDDLTVLQAKNPPQEFHAVY